MRVIEQLGLVDDCGRFIRREEAELRFGPVSVALARVVDRGDVDRRHGGSVDVFAVVHVPIPALVCVIPVWRRCVKHAFEKVEVQLVGNRFEPIGVSQFALAFPANEVLVLSR